MNDNEIARILDDADAALRGGGPVDLGKLGFWRAVAAVKRDPALAERHADRIGAIDREAFVRWALLTVPFPLGTLIAALGVVAGLGVVASGYYVDAPANGLLLLAGTAVVFTAVHSLTHAVVGMQAGMRFSHWFVGSLTRPQPGVKVDYATYLRTPARSSRRHARIRSNRHESRAVPHARGSVGHGRTRVGVDRTARHRCGHDRHRCRLVDEVV